MGVASICSCVKALQEAGLKVLCDAILNHRCASAQVLLCCPLLGPIGMAVHKMLSS